LAEPEEAGLANWFDQIVGGSDVRNADVLPVDKVVTALDPNWMAGIIPGELDYRTYQSGMDCVLPHAHDESRAGDVGEVDAGIRGLDGYGDVCKRQAKPGDVEEVGHWHAAFGDSSLTCAPGGKGGPSMLFVPLVLRG